MGALLHDVPVLHHQDHVRIPDGGEAVGDHERGAVRAQGCHGLLDQHLRTGVHRGGGLVQDQQGGIGQEGTGDGDQLAFAGRDVRALVLDHRVIPVRQGVHEAVRVGGAGRGHDLLVRGVQPAVPDVLADGPTEQHRVLQHHADLSAQHPSVQGGGVHPVQQDPAGVDLVEPHDQVDQGGLARTRGADDRHGLARFGGQGQVRDQRLVRGVGEGHVLELDPPAHRLGQLVPAGALGEVRLLLVRVQQLKDPLSRGHPGDEHVGHAGHLTQGLVELPGVLDERGHRAQGHLPGGHAQSAHHGDPHVAQVVHPLHDRHDHARVELGLERGLVELLVALVEPLAHVLLAAEHGHQFMPGEGLLDVPVQLTGVPPLGSEQLLGLGADDPDHHAGQRQGDQRDQRQLPGEPEHHEDDADDGQH